MLNTNSAALAIGVLLAAAGCERARDGRTTVVFWAMGSEGERVQPLIAQFEREHPDVRVSIQAVPWTAAHEKLLTAFAGDALPDVCQLGNTWIAEFAALGALVDLTDRVGPGRGVDPAAYFSGVWQSNVVDGRVRGVPWYVDTRLMFYRKDILAKAGHDHPPRTWDEWMQTMRDVQANQPEGSYAALLPTNEFEQPIIFGHQTGSEMLLDGGRRGGFSEPEFRRAFEFYVNIFREGLAPAVSNTRISNVWLEFERGTFAMYISGPWNVDEFRRRMSPAMKGKWTTAPLPGPDGQWPGASVAGGCSLVLFQHDAGESSSAADDSAQRRAAWQLIEFLSSVEQQVGLARCTSNLPACDAAWEASGLIDGPEYLAFHEQLKNVCPAPATPEWELIVSGELVKMAEVVIAGRKSVEEGLEQLDRKVDQILEKRRWMLARQGDSP